MVIHSRGVCCGTSYFAPHVLGSDVGDKVFYTRSNGVDEGDDDVYICQVCGNRDTSECSTCDLYLCSGCMCEHTCEIEVPE